MNCFQTKLLGLIVIATIAFQGCDNTCKNAQSEEIGGESFTVEYRTADGKNYINEIYNQSELIVFLDTTGGESLNPKYELITPGFEDGKFGPFFFTERYVDAASDQINDILLFNKNYAFDYYIKKDTYGQDTLRVEFLVVVNECSFEWGNISYFLNGVPLAEYEDQTNPEIIITE